MKILVLGGDGYLGWPTAMYLSAKGHDLCVVDNYFKRKAEKEFGIKPLIPIPSLNDRCKVWQAVTGRRIRFEIGDICDYPFLSRVINSFEPESVIHFAEQPSAPYSMIDLDKAVFTLTNNLIGTVNTIYALRKFTPETHLVKLGTMGEYGTPNIDIEEGFLDVEHNGRKDRVLFPKKPGSIYHMSKVHDSDELYFATRIWDLRITDLNQGPVYGIETDEIQMDRRLATCFYYDEIFGTVLNRFAVQAVTGVPLTVYGKGKQVRGYLNLRDVLQCVELAVNQPCAKGEFRVLNQFTEQFSVLDLAERVRKVAQYLGYTVKIQSIQNPRKEAEEHYYNAQHTGLLELGLKPSYLSDEIIERFLHVVEENKENILVDRIMPKITWN